MRGVIEGSCRTGVSTNVHVSCSCGWVAKALVAGHRLQAKPPATAARIAKFRISEDDYAAAISRHTAEPDATDRCDRHGGGVRAGRGARWPHLWPLLLVGLRRRHHRAFDRYGADAGPPALRKYKGEKKFKQVSSCRAARQRLAHGVPHWRGHALWENILTCGSVTFVMVYRVPALSPPPHVGGEQGLDCRDYRAPEPHVGPSLKSESGPPEASQAEAEHRALARCAQ